MSIQWQTKQKIEAVEAQAKAGQELAEFRASRAAAVSAATVTIGGNVYNADRDAIQNMTAAVVAGVDEPDDFALVWSMADTPSGHMTPITLGELRRALRAATEQLAQLWAR